MILMFVPTCFKWELKLLIPQEEIDDSLYVYGKKGPQKPKISVSDDHSSEHSTCQSNDSEESCENTSEHSFKTESESLSEPNEMSKSRLEVTNEQDVSAPKSKEVEPSCVSTVKIVTIRKEMAREAEVKRVVSTGNGVAKPEHPLKNMVDRGIFDSGCSGHMTCNKDQLEDFKEFNGGSVTFGELGHFNLFSISQICDKQHKVLFTETECLVVSSDFKMPDENQILLNVPRDHNMYSLHKNTSPAKDKPNVKGVGYRWMFDIDYLTDSMNYIPVSLENQANPHAGASEVTNSAGTSQTPKSIASEEKDEEVELIVVPSAITIPEEKDESRTSSTNSKKEETLTEPQKEMKDSSTDPLEDNPKIQAFRRELEEIALKHLGTVPETNTNSTSSVNTGSQTVNTGRLDHDDSLMPELKIFHKPETGIFDATSYDEEEEPKKIAEALQDDSWVQAIGI
ncbi:hypothetical protein Tco_0190796 [Tanacetum coccineum]